MSLNCHGLPRGFYALGMTPSCSPGQDHGVALAALRAVVGRHDDAPWPADRPGEVLHHQPLPRQHHVQQVGERLLVLRVDAAAFEDVVESEGVDERAEPFVERRVGIDRPLEPWEQELGGGERGAAGRVFTVD
jgi:hypothetical protein